MKTSDKKPNFSESELRNQLTTIRKEISSLESFFDVQNGSGFGGGISDEKYILYQVNFKKDQENRLVRDLNDLLLKKTKKSSNIAAVFSAIATTIVAITEIIRLFK